MYLVVKKKKMAHNIQVEIQMSRKAFFKVVWSAMNPTIAGAVAAPRDSIKYWIDTAVLRTSGRVMSYTVEITLGEAKGMKMAVNPSNTVNRMTFSIGTFKVK